MRSSDEAVRPEWSERGVMRAEESGHARFSLTSRPLLLLFLPPDALFLVTHFENSQFVFHNSTSLPSFLPPPQWGGCLLKATTGLEYLSPDILHCVHSLIPQRLNEHRPDTGQFQKVTFKINKTGPRARYDSAWRYSGKFSEEVTFKQKAK